jgi:RHS repeat-associated protein
VVLKRYFPQGMRSEAGASVPAGNYFYSRDHLSSVREMTDLGGTVRAQYEYSPYGFKTRIAGDLDADWGFTGHAVHQASGLNLTLYRAYDPRLGRWLTRDPANERAGLNLYAYVHDDPLNWMDPLGLDETLTTLPPRAPYWERQKATWGRRIDSAEAGAGEALDYLVKKFGPKSVKVGPVSVSLEKPDISVGGSAGVEIKGKTIISVSAECGGGVNTEGTASDPIFNVRGKLGVNTILSKVPVIGKFFKGEVSGEAQVGKVDNYHGQTRSMNNANNTITGGEIVQ